MLYLYLSLPTDETIRHALYGPPFITTQYLTEGNVVIGEIDLVKDNDERTINI